MLSALGRRGIQNDRSNAGVCEPRLSGLGVVLFATVLGHRLSVAVSRELAAVLLRDRRARRREEVPLKWHV